MLCVCVLTYVRWGIWVSSVPWPKHSDELHVWKQTFSQLTPSLQQLYSICSVHTYSRDELEVIATTSSPNGVLCKVQYTVEREIFVGENFRESLKIRSLQKTFCMCNFAVNIHNISIGLYNKAKCLRWIMFANGSLSTIFAKIFSCKNFPLYGMLNVRMQESMYIYFWRGVTECVVV